MIRGELFMISILVVVTIGIMLAIFLAGPRVEIDTTIHPLHLPDDLVDYLARSEEHVPDLIPGTEKTIIWHGETGVKTSFCVIYFHGFSASRQETAPLPELVANSLQANLFYTRFTGHGRTGEALLEGTVNSWLNDIHEALEIGKRLGEKSIVIGMSTGATAATWLATQPFAEHVAAFILISPNFALADKRSVMLTWPWGGHLAELLNGPEYSYVVHNDLHRRYWTHRYPIRALLPMMAFVKYTRSQDFSALTTPVQVIYSPQDQVIRPDVIEQEYERIGSPHKQLVSFIAKESPKQHVLAGDILAPGSTARVREIILSFLQDLGLHTP